MRISIEKGEKSTQKKNKEYGIDIKVGAGRVLGPRLKTPKISLIRGVCIHKIASSILKST